MCQPDGDVAMGIDFRDVQRVGSDFNIEDLFMVELEGIQRLANGLRIEVIDGGQVLEESLEIANGVVRAQFTIAKHPKAVLLAGIEGMALLKLGILEGYNGLAV